MNAAAAGLRMRGDEADAAAVAGCVAVVAVALVVAASAQSPRAALSHCLVSRTAA